MTIEYWVFVDGFTQPGGEWRAARPVNVDPATYLGPPIGGSFADAAFEMGWQTPYLEQERRLERTAYVGYSQGGRLCLQLALDRPEVVHALV
ncbi:MAG: hypothetical protein ACHQIG_13790, partial [Acidimicrobiia bacterium]